MLKTSRQRVTKNGLAPVYTKAEDAGMDFMAYFKKNFRVHIVSESEDGMELVFDMVGVDAPVANALRRILLAEVPTVAIEHVYFTQNLSIIPDEVLAHRLGLVPLRVDPRKLRSLNEEGVEFDEFSGLVFTLHATGKKVEMTPAEVAAMEGGDDFEGRYTKVYSRQLVWQPVGDQERDLGVVEPVHGDILLAKLAPGQEINLEAHAVKSIGKDHAKFSPVATASYRLLPDVTLSESDPFVDAQADALVAACPRGVFDIEDIGGRRTAVVKRPRDCTVCRECVRDEDWARRVAVERISDHYIFSIESTGALPARDLLKEALGVLVNKAAALKEGLVQAEARDDGGVLPPSALAKATIAAMRTEPDELA